MKIAITKTKKIGMVMVVVVMMVVTSVILWSEFGSNNTTNYEQEIPNKESYAHLEAANIMSRFMKKLGKAGADSQEENRLLQVYRTCDNECPIETVEDLSNCTLSIAVCLEQNM